MKINARFTSKVIDLCPPLLASAAGILYYTVVTSVPNPDL